MILQKERKIINVLKLNKYNNIPGASSIALYNQKLRFKFKKLNFFYYYFSLKGILMRFYYFYNFFFLFF